MYTKLIGEYRFDPSEDPKRALLDLVHYGYICIVDENSNVIYEAGESNDMVFWRSASKPIQSLPVFKYGLDEKYGIDEKETVIFSASHTAEPFHVEALESILKKSGLTEDMLCMNPAIPTNVQANEERIRNGVPSRSIYHNCSGKHVALLLVQRHLGGKLEDYWKADTPVFYETQKTVQAVAEAERIFIGVDGCGVPVFSTPIKNIAIAFKNLACPDRILDEALQAAAVKNTARISKYPEMIRGSGFLCSLMNMDPNIIAKGGANGVYGFGLKKQRLGVAFKFVDGTEAAWPFMAMEILRALGALTPEHEQRLNTLHPRYFINDNEKVVGERRCEVKIHI